MSGWRVAGLTIGIGLIVFGIVWVPVCVVFAFLTANPCGMFADHCEDYGKTSPVAAWSIVAAFLGVPIVIAGLALTLVSILVRPPPYPEVR